MLKTNLSEQERADMLTAGYSFGLDLVDSLIWDNGCYNPDTYRLECHSYVPWQDGVISGIESALEKEGLI